MGPLGSYLEVFFSCLYLQWSSKVVLEASGLDFGSILNAFCEVWGGSGRPGTIKNDGLCRVMAGFVLQLKLAPVFVFSSVGCACLLLLSLAVSCFLWLSFAFSCLRLLSLAALSVPLLLRFLGGSWYHFSHLFAIFSIFLRVLSHLAFLWQFLTH